ncbi:MAG TPA: acyl-CoA dehydrogenase family protein [Kofleriaceae bacterium]|jgi:alkylation response protein AidB-like acyl-CoA dehydrogenase|nr:acyl-CoA dehydrogenase family protein [Kofleriaceae bacterium]
MDLAFSPAEEAFRAEARAWLRAHVPRDLPPSGSKDGFAAHVAWEQQLHAAGWSVVAWPKAYGGRDASIVEWLIFEEEYYLAGAPPRVTQNGIFLLAPALFEYGTDEQRARILPPMAAAEVLWAQGWSEPGAGSDLAAVSSTAVRVDGGWRLRGQKTWSTRASFCHAMHGLFRTDPAAPRHKGLTYFLVPLDAPGVRVNGFRRLDGDEDFAEIFFDDVFVADQDVLGPVNGGWKVAMATTGSERGLTLRSPGRFLAAAERLVGLYRRTRPGPLLRDQVVRAWMDAHAYQLLTLQTVSRLIDGHALGAESSVSKLAWSELDLRLHETALGLLGGHAELAAGAPDAVDGGAWQKGFQFALAGPIYAGTNEIQKNVVAERLLGLPKE